MCPFLIPRLWLNKRQISSFCSRNGEEGKQNWNRTPPLLPPGAFPMSILAPRDAEMRLSCPKQLVQVTHLVKQQSQISPWD